jgi:SWI/SNF-related matrix-associated actin-dependent regulator 1 of chromatin subfamily A
MKEIKAEKSAYHKYAFYFSFDVQAVDFCRALKQQYGWQTFTFNADEGQKRWVFSDIKFIDMIKKQWPDVEIDAETKLIYNRTYMNMRAEQTKMEKVEAVKEKTDSNMKINGLKGELYPYQKVGVEFLLASGGRALIADPPGLGKSLQALAYAIHTKKKRSLFIAPASVKSSWEKEVKKWTDMSYVVIDSKTKIKDIPKDVKVWIINYDILKKHLDALLKTNFDLVVADESHLVKSPKAQRTKAVMAITKSVKEVIFLTGTPLLSRPVEMFTMLNMIDPETWGNWYDFTRKYCAGHQDRFGYNTSGTSNPDELHTRIKRYFIRRQKADVLTDLPPKVRDVRPVPLSPAIRREYDAAEADLASYLFNHKGKQSAEVASAMAAEQLARLNILRQLTAMGKIDAAKDLIDSILESGEKVIVFSSFMEPLRALEEKYGDKVVKITGETAVEERGAIVTDFQENPKKQIFLGGIKSAGVGITLTAASNVLFLDYAWTPADMLQAEDRVHRPGQEATSANIYTLHAPNTIDERLLQLLEVKQEAVDTIVEGFSTEEAQESRKAQKLAMKGVIGDILERHNKQEAVVSERAVKELISNMV